MQVKCPVCGNMLRPKAALDPAQFFVYSLSLIDLIDEKLENFISETEYGPYITFAYWLGMITKEELDEIIRLKQITGLRDSFANHVFSKSWEEFEMKQKK